MASAASCACSKAVTPPTDKELEKNPKLAEQYRRDARGIIVKRFDEVPVADVEIVFPDKDVGLKLIDVLTLWGTALGALVAGVMMFVRGSVSLNVLMSALTTVGGKLFQVRWAVRFVCLFLESFFCVRPICRRIGWSARRCEWSSGERGGRVQTYATMQRKKADLSKQMAQTVFDVSLDANEGAIYGVLDEMADQYIKEQMLAYFMLVKHKYPATEARPRPRVPPAAVHAHVPRHRGAALALCHVPHPCTLSRMHACAPHNRRVGRAHGCNNSSMRSARTSAPGRAHLERAQSDARARVQEELDEMCESFLSERYDMKVDFAIEESLPKLMADGLIEGSGDPSDPRLHAVPLDVAQERLMRKWQRCAPPLPATPRVRLLLHRECFARGSRAVCASARRDGVEERPCAARFRMATTTRTRRPSRAPWAAAWRPPRPPPAPSAK